MIFNYMKGRFYNGLLWTSTQEALDPPFWLYLYFEPGHAKEYINGLCCLDQHKEDCNDDDATAG